MQDGRRNIKEGKAETLASPYSSAVYLIPVSSLLPSPSSLTRLHPSRGFILISLRWTILRDNLTTFLSPSSIRSLASPDDSFIIISTPPTFCTGTWCKYLEVRNKTDGRSRISEASKIRDWKLKGGKKTFVHPGREKNILQSNLDVYEYMYRT